MLYNAQPSELCAAPGRVSLDTEETRFCVPLSAGHWVSRVRSAQGRGERTEQGRTLHGPRDVLAASTPCSQWSAQGSRRPRRDVSGFGAQGLGLRAAFLQTALTRTPQLSRC